MNTVSIINAEDDEVNIAQFHPLPGQGILYGTKRGKVRVYSREYSYADDENIQQIRWV